MKQRIHFTKMQGAGNDYIYVDSSLFKIQDPAKAARAWSDRHDGIGSDGLVLIGTASGDKADFSMRIFNADGSEALMCGNASRCIGKYVYERYRSIKTHIRLETASGIKDLWIKPSGQFKGKAESVTVDMLSPVIDSGGPLKMSSCGRTFEGYRVSVGNPHFVIFCEDDVDPYKYGPEIELNPLFPERTNVEFVQLISRDCLRVRVWERGSGVTQACGSGACAAVAAAYHKGLCSCKPMVEMDGGTLEVEWKSEDSHIYLTGPAEFVFEGDIDYSE